MLKTISSIHTVRLAELQPLDKLVAVNLPSQSFPLYIVKTLQDVIAQRRKSNKYYTRRELESADKMFQKSNDGHRHMISVLEAVLAVLDNAILKGRSTGNDHVVPADTQRQDRLPNQFQALEVDGLDSDESDDTMKEMDPNARFGSRKT